MADIRVFVAFATARNCMLTTVGRMTFCSFINLCFIVHLCDGSSSLTICIFLLEIQRVNLDSEHRAVVGGLHINRKEFSDSVAA